MIAESAGASAAVLTAESRMARSPLELHAATAKTMRPVVRRRTVAFTFTPDDGWTLYYSPQPEVLVRRVIAIAVVLVSAFVVARRTYVSPASTAPRPSSVPATVPAPAPSGTAAPPAARAPDVAGNATIARAFANRARDVPVHGAGVVSRVLADDREGDRHQRFLVRLPSGQSILIAHNIDVAPRVANLRVGDAIEFEGEYVWNVQGGLVHWTHRDPAGRHTAGWLRYRGRTYQ